MFSNDITINQEDIDTILNLEGINKVFQGISEYENLLDNIKQVTQGNLSQANGIIFNFKMNPNDSVHSIGNLIEDIFANNIQEEALSVFSTQTDKNIKLGTVAFEITLTGLS